MLYYSKYMLHVSVLQGHRQALRVLKFQFKIVRTMLPHSLSVMNIFFTLLYWDFNTVNAWWWSCIAETCNISFWIIIIIITVFCPRASPSLDAQEPRLQFCWRQVFHHKLRNQGYSFTRDWIGAVPSPCFPQSFLTT